MKKLFIITIFSWVVCWVVSWGMADERMIDISMDGETIESIPVEEYQGRVNALNYFGELIKAEQSGRIYLQHGTKEFNVIWKNDKGEQIKKIDFVIVDNGVEM
jgi:hypothetical protein